MVDNNDANKKPENPQRRPDSAAPSGEKKVLKKKKKKIHSEQSSNERPKSHKNAILFLIAIILFIYLGFLKLYPAILNATFNKDEFTEKVYTTTGLLTSVDKIDFSLTPTFTLVIGVNNWVMKHLDNQECFSFARADIETNPFCIFTKNFVIKKMEIRSANYFDQVYDNGQNKLNYLSDMNFSKFNAKNENITVASGPVSVRNFRITYIEPQGHREDKRDVVKYTKADVRAFLQERMFKHIVVK